MANPNFLTGLLALGTGSSSFAELIGTGYARQAITFSGIAGASCVSIPGQTFACAGTWSQITQFGIFSATGSLLFWWNKTDPMTVASGATLTAPVFSITMPDLMGASPAASLIYAPGAVVGTVNGLPLIAGAPLQVASLQIGAF